MESQTDLDATSARGAMSPDLRSLTSSVAALFFVNGMVFSNWLPRIPEVRDHLGITNQGLGLSLVGGGLGGLVGSFLVAPALQRFGTKRVLTVAATAGAIGLPLISIANSAFLVFAALTLIGFCDVLNDMSMNAQAVMAQRRHDRPILNRMHGAWSLGFFVGAGTGSIARAADISIRIHFCMVAIVMLITIYTARRGLLRNDEANPDDPKVKGKQGFRISTGVVAMSVTAVAIAAFESTPNDWSAVLLRDLFEVENWTGLATLTFAGCMLLGRLGGDHALERLGSQRLLNAAFAIMLIGVAVVVVAPEAILSIVGFGLWGLGVSVLFPQLYATAATLPGASPGAGLAAMAVGQRLGFLGVPVVLGSVAEATTLRFGISVVAAAAMLFVLGARSQTKSA